MNAPSPARRVRGRFMNFSLWTSALAFFFIEGYALQDQLAIGHASIIFMLGTACLAAGASIGLFAIIAAIGFAVSAAFSEDPPPQQSHDLDQRRTTVVMELERPQRVRMTPGDTIGPASVPIHGGAASDGTGSPAGASPTLGALARHRPRTLTSVP
jgi:membrane protein implicated in regulation of membrane protease activity